MSAYRQPGTALKTDADAEFKIRILRGSILFQNAPEDDLAEIARVARMAAFQHGKPLSKEGKEGAQVYVLQSGVAAELLIEPGAEDGILMALHGPGAVAGAVSALTKKDASTAAEDDVASGRRIEALSNVQALIAPAADVLRICRRNADLSIGLAELIAAQNEQLGRAFARSTHHSLEMRLAAFFSQMAHFCSTEDWNPVSNIGRLSQSAVASMLGVSREHVNRTLAIWERSGLIFQNKKGDILVQNARRLDRLAEASADRAIGDRQEDWLWEIDAHLDRGLNQTALHLSLEAAKRAPKDLRYMHKAVLATARMGAISEALALIDKHKLGRDLADEELACLRPRLLRDLAFAENPTEPDRKNLEASARDYEKVYEKTRGFYPGVNAAAGFALIGEREKSRAIAAEVSRGLARNATEDDSDSYWRRTTLAECKLLEGDKAGAASLFEAASTADDATPGKKSTTRKQLFRLSASVGIDRAWIDRVTPQSEVMFFCGPLAREEVDDGALPLDRLVKEVDRLLDERSIAWAYGALASGADIVIAERLIAAGVELNIYLPLPPHEFLKFSVHIGGPAWRERFVRCMRAASSIEWNRRAAIPCNATYKLGAEVTMGKAVRHAAQLETTAVGFFAVPDDRGAEESLSIAGAALWRGRGHFGREVKDRWPPKPNGQAREREADHALCFALVVDDEGRGKPLKAAPRGAGKHLRDIESGVDLLLFDSLHDAVAAASVLSNSPAAKAWRLWLDAGVFTTASLDKRPDLAAAQLVVSACKPLTEPGKVFASEPFACAAPLASSVSANFEYVGFVPTREKVDPCAMYLMRF